MQNPPHGQSSLPPRLSSHVSRFIGIDEGRNKLLKFSPANPQKEWCISITGKSRTLQTLDENRLLMVSDTGFSEIDTTNGEMLSETKCCSSGVISAFRLQSGHTFIGGLDLFNRKGVTFAELDSHTKLVRQTTFPGDYVRRATLTATDTILFTCDSRVYEGDWSGAIIREFAATGFRHAWKAVRTKNNTTIISAGYGAFVAEFDINGGIIQRWECTKFVEAIRPHFFGDFELLPSGELLVCNWLGHGEDLGRTGHSLLLFSSDGDLLATWQDAARISSLQTFVLTID
ncbi:MAG: hypothetical protein QM715_08150 [Nibricoccus sp.]